MIVLTGFNQGAKMTQASRRPELTAAFEAALPLPTGGFHRTGADRPALVRHRLVIHPPRVLGKIVLLPLYPFGPLSFTRRQLRNLPQRYSLPAMSQLVQFPFHPSARQLPISMQRFPQVPQLLAGMIKIQQLDRSTPTVLRQVPNPRRAVADDQLLSRCSQPALARLLMQTPAQFHRLALPTHDRLLGQQTPAIFPRRVLLQIKHSGLQFVPFHARLLRFALAPARTALGAPASHQA